MRIIIPIVILLLIVHSCAYVLGFRDFVPSLIKKLVRGLIRFVGQALLRFLRAIIEGIREGLQAINRRTT